MVQLVQNFSLDADNVNYAKKAPLYAHKHTFIQTDLAASSL